MCGDSNCRSDDRAQLNAGEIVTVSDTVCFHCRKTRRKFRRVFSYLRSHLKPKRIKQTYCSSISTSSSTSSHTSKMIDKKVVLFDLGGVIVTPPQRALLKYCEEAGLPRNFIFNVISQGRANNTFARLERGEITVTQFATEFEQECRRVAEAQSLVIPDSFSATEMVNFKDPDLIPEMLNAVAVLKENGVQTCALTNNYIDNTSNRAYAAGGLTAFTFYFDEFVESCRLGIRKPDPNIFHEALARLGAEASQAVFLDDSEVNTKAAEALGITSILVQDPKTALEQLKIVTGIDVFKQAGPITVHPDEVTHSYVTTRSKVRFHFTELGSGPPVVLCHDFEEDWEAWRSLMPELAIAGFRAIALDLKGFGESSKPTDTEQYTLKILCRDMTEFLDALGIAQVTLIGKGMGSAFAWTFANHTTDRVRAVAGINTSPSVVIPDTFYGDQIKRIGSLQDYIKFRHCDRNNNNNPDIEMEQFYRIATCHSSDTNPAKDDRCLQGIDVKEDFELSTKASMNCLCIEADKREKKQLGGHHRSTKSKSKSRGANWFRNNAANWEWNRRLNGRMLLIPALVVTSGQGSPKDVPDVSELKKWIPDVEHSHVSGCEIKTDRERSSELNRILRKWLFTIYAGEHTPLMPL
ncbi:soluble epoxide hydrolase-like protein 2 isoform X1 [Strongylocentrotus purpuratus]|uniref:AB hydrolase-1 domain-containing protein n=1 Tax=Strongylocentrotus purpuratus TaxID=7668 RepID=A0A7M7HJ48_STRPU|nr:soluble epoxide hydrolase-like protein 2 isoform X1 [Strongylocentrotus purpuratus]